MKKVLIFGTFDVIHEGHRNMFAQARAHGDHLTVVLARDETVTKVKGTVPYYTEMERLLHVTQEELVDVAILGNHGDKYQVVGDQLPDVIALGYDQFTFTDNLQEYLNQIDHFAEIVRLESHAPETFKSSIIKKQRGLQK